MARRSGLIDELLVKHAVPSGFVKRGRVLLRKVGLVSQLVDIQYERVSLGGERRFTLNCGVYAPGTTAFLRGKPEPLAIALADCCAYVRVGMLLDARIDLWWGGEPTDEGARAATALGDAWRSGVLGYFEQLSTLERIGHFLTGKESAGWLPYLEPRHRAIRLAYAASLYCELGQAGRAGELVNESLASARGTALADASSMFAKKLAARGCGGARPQPP